MSSLAATDKYIVTVKGLQIDFYDYTNHTKVAVPTNSLETDVITDVEISENGKYMALITSASKKMLVYELPSMTSYKSFILPRSASKIRFTIKNAQILVADKSGDVLLYDIEDENSGTKLLGHLSLLLDVLQSKDEKYIITSDRDEKIRVTCYPNTYNIQTYCLGHKEFVNHIELLPHDSSYLTSTSGDGYIKCWNYVKGSVCYSIDTYLDVNDSESKDSFIKAMDNEGIEVNALPIVHYGVTQVDQTSSLLAVAVHNYNNVLVYKLKSENHKFSHILIQKLQLDRFPSSIKCFNSSLFIYNSNQNYVTIYKVHNEDSNVSVKYNKKIQMFEKVTFDDDVKENNHEFIRVLYKRKFDNVQEYQERKRQRLEKKKF